ncbi:MAG: sel1 repeat family protein [Deltaproteobacteria bacterium]|nr:sel1 repeat family protein [Deltaproteobacteria bacterium]
MSLQNCFQRKNSGSWIVMGSLIATLVSCNRIDFSPERLHGVMPPGALEPGLTERANRGDPGAQYRIATMWMTAEPGKRDYAQALEWYTRAADAGHAQSQSALGRLLVNGFGLAEPDFEAGRRWLELAIEHGDSSAVYNLGMVYERGQGVPVDLVRAISLFRRAADLGLLNAQNALGRAYESGMGVEVDLEEALRWYQSAAEQGFAVAQYTLGDIYQNGKGVERDAAEAVTWFRLAAEQGYPPAQAQLGYMYAAGDGVPLRYEDAARWSRAAGEQQDPDGCNNLAVLYLKGFGVGQDFEESLQWYRRAAEYGHAGALTGQGAEKNVAEAERFWNAAAAQNYAPALYNLGGMFSRKLSPEMTREEAEKWLSLAAAQGHQRAEYELAELRKKPAGESESEETAMPARDRAGTTQRTAS